MSGLTRRAFNLLGGYAIGSLAGLFASRKPIPPIWPDAQPAPELTDVLEIKLAAPHLPLITAVIYRESEDVRITAPGLSWGWDLTHKLIAAPGHRWRHFVDAHAAGVGLDGVPLRGRIKFRWTREPDGTITAQVNVDEFWFESGLSIDRTPPGLIVHEAQPLDFLTLTHT